MTAKATDSSLRKSLLVVEESRKVDPEMPAQMMSTFLVVAQHPGIIAREVSDRTG